MDANLINREESSEINLKGMPAIIAIAITIIAGLG